MNLSILIHLEYTSSQVFVFGMYQLPLLNARSISHLLESLPKILSIRVSRAPYSEGRENRRILLRYAGPSPLTLFCSIPTTSEPLGSPSSLKNGMFILSEHFTLPTFRSPPHLATDNMSPLSRKFFLAFFVSSSSRLRMPKKPVFHRSLCHS